MPSPAYAHHLLSYLALKDVLEGTATTLDELKTKYGVVDSTLQRWQHRWWRFFMRGPENVDQLLASSTTLHTREDIAAWNKLAVSTSAARYTRAFSIIVENRVILKELWFDQVVAYLPTKSEIS